MRAAIINNTAAACTTIAAALRARTSWRRISHASPATISANARTDCARSPPATDEFTGDRITPPLNETLVRSCAVRGFAGSRVRGFAGSRVRGFAAQSRAATVTLRSHQEINRRKENGGAKLFGFLLSPYSRVRGFA